MIQWACVLCLGAGNTDYLGICLVSLWGCCHRKSRLGFVCATTLPPSPQFWPRENRGEPRTEPMQRVYGLLLLGVLSETLMPHRSDKKQQLETAQSFPHCTSGLPNHSLLRNPLFPSLSILYSSHSTVSKKKLF